MEQDPIQARPGEVPSSGDKERIADLHKPPPGTPEGERLPIQSLGGRASRRLPALQPGVPGAQCPEEGAPPPAAGGHSSMGPNVGPAGVSFLSKDYASTTKGSIAGEGASSGSAR